MYLSIHPPIYFTEFDGYSPFPLSLILISLESTFLGDLKIIGSVFSRLSEILFALNQLQKQPSRSVLINRCSGNMQQIYWITPMPKCDFNKVAFLEGCFCNYSTVLYHGWPAYLDFSLTYLYERFVSSVKWCSLKCWTALWRSLTL